MHVDPADVWEARLRDAPAASAAEAILASLLGYRDSHVLHADDVAQLASALEAWGTLVLGGARPDGSPFVPPTSDERASAAASLEAIAFAERERSAAVAALAAHVSAEASRVAAAADTQLAPGTYEGLIESLDHKSGAPTVRLGLRLADGRRLTHWTHRANAAGLAVGARYSFRIDLVPFHDGTSDA